jgi:hypothetical protein
MDDYKINFDLDSKIAQNRHRLREQFEQYKKIENYYPLFLAYIGAFGIYFFDFLLLFGGQNPLFTLVTLLTIFTFLWVCYLMYDMISTKKWLNDSLPKEIYGDHLENFKKVNPSVTDETVLIDEVKKSYLMQLESWNDTNFNTYNNKKQKFPLLFKTIILSLVLYSVNITMYKHIKMSDETKKTEQQINIVQPQVIQPKITNEGASTKDTTTKVILTEQAGQNKKP